MKYKVTYDGITKTYVPLYHTAWYLFHSVNEQRHAGARLNLQAAAVFYAFAFEAYLNHVGAEEIEIWEEIERISHTKKLRIIAKHLKLSLDQSRPPFQTLAELFGLRDILAHGRTRIIDVEYETNDEPPRLSSWRIHEWEKLTAEKVDGYADSVHKAIEIINKARVCPDKDLWGQGMRGRRVETIEKKR